MSKWNLSCDLKEYILQKNYNHYTQATACCLEDIYIVLGNYKRKSLPENLIDLPALLRTSVSMSIRRHSQRFAAQEST